MQPENGRPLEFNRIYGPDAERDFWVRLNDLAYDLADLLSPARATAQRATTRPGLSGAASSNLQADRDALRRELAAARLRRAAGLELPLVAGELERGRRAALARARCSIHLVGRNYGVVPEGATQSMAAMQERAGHRAGRAGALRAPGLDPAGPGRRRCATAEVAHRALRDRPAHRHGRRHARDAVRGLHTASSLAARRCGTAATARTERRRDRRRCRSVYLICRPARPSCSGRGASTLFDEQLRSHPPRVRRRRGADPQGPRREALDLRRVLFFYGEATSSGCGRSCARSRRAPGYGRKKPMRCVSICADRSAVRRRRSASGRTKRWSSRSGSGVGTSTARCSRLFGLGATCLTNRRSCQSVSRPAHLRAGRGPPVLRPRNPDRRDPAAARAAALPRRRRHVGERQVVARPLGADPVALRRHHGRAPARAGASRSSVRAKIRSATSPRRSTRPRCSATPARDVATPSSVLLEVTLRRSALGLVEACGRRGSRAARTCWSSSTSSRSSSASRAAGRCRVARRGDRVRQAAARRGRQQTTCRSTSSSRCARTSSATAWSSTGCPRRSTTASTWCRG